MPVSHVEHGTDYTPNTTLFVVLRHEITILIIFKINRCFIEEKTDSDMGKIYAVGVGTGSPSYVTDEVKNVVILVC